MVKGGRPEHPETSSYGLIRHMEMQSKALRVIERMNLCGKIVRLRLVYIHHDGSKL